MNFQRGLSRGAGSAAGRVGTTRDSAERNFERRGDQRISEPMRCQRTSPVSDSRLK
jgi:hypothetical protein